MICLFFFNDTATTEIYTLSLHDALPISLLGLAIYRYAATREERFRTRTMAFLKSFSLPWFAILGAQDRKSTRLNSSHSQISYAVFCLKKKTIARWSRLPDALRDVTIGGR